MFLFFFFFCCGHPKLQIRPTILECAGSHQRNGANPVCIRCIVFEIQLAFLLLWGLVHGNTGLPLSEMHEPRTVSQEPCNVYKRDLHRYVSENLQIAMIPLS